jgi:NitT/TauT family transport system substrate-binding protein
MNNRTRYLTAALAVLVGVAATFTWIEWRNDGGSSIPEGKAAVVRIGGPNNIAMLPLIAARKGYFENAGVKVEFKSLQTGKLAMDALNSGDIDLATMVDSNIAFVRFQGGGDIRVICTIQEKYDDAIVARVDRGIHEPGDLIGKKIGFAPATTSHIFLSRYLTYKNIDASQLSLVPMTPPAMQPALIRGDVDAISIWQPFRNNALNELGANGVEFNDKKAYVAFAVVAGRLNFLSTHEVECQKILSALIRAEQFVRDNRDEAMALLAEAIPMQPDALTAAWEEYEVRVRLDPGLLKLLEEEGRWIKATQDGFADKELPVYSATIDTAILKKVAPERVGTD